MARLKGIVVTVVTKDEQLAETNDRIFLGVMGPGGGSEFPLETTNVPLFKRGSKIKLRYGDVWEGAALSEAQPALEADGKNDPEGRFIELDQVKNVYLRKSGTVGGADDEWELDEVEVTLYGDNPQKRTFLKREDIWVGNQYGLQLSLKEKKPYLFIANAETNQLSALDITTTPPAVVETMQVPNPRQLAVSPSKARLYVANGASQSVTIIDTTARPMKVTATVPLGVEPHQIAVHPSGHKIYVSCGPYDAGVLKVIDVSVVPPTILATVPAQGPAFGPLAVTPDGQTLFVTGGPKPTPQEDHDTISVYDISGATPVFSTSIVCYFQSPSFLYMNTAGTRIYAGFTKGGINIIDVPSRHSIGCVGSAEVAGSALSPDGSKLLVGYIPVGGYSLYSTLPDPPTAVYNWNDDNHRPGSMLFSPDSKRLYMISGTNEELVVYDMSATIPTILSAVPFGTHYYSAMAL